MLTVVCNDTKFQCYSVVAVYYSHAPIYHVVRSAYIYTATKIFTQQFLPVLCAHSFFFLFYFWNSLCIEKMCIFTTKRQLDGGISQFRTISMWVFVNILRDKYNNIIYVCVCVSHRGVEYRIAMCLNGIEQPIKWNGKDSFSFSYKYGMDGVRRIQFGWTFSIWLRLSRETFAI